ncbi:MAG: ROK family protein [Deltaproteobacteria bacterium]|nr:ROK family protein [Deltaproteobacteria bacterium]
MKVLAIDIGGTHVKILATGEKEKREVDSGPTLTPRRMVSAVKRLARGWTYDVIAMGYPGPVLHDKPMLEPHNLGTGWVGFDYGKAFGKPVRILNDAAMQALGSYKGGRMLFLGLGTGLGTALIVDGVVEPLELAHLPYKKGKTFEDFVGLRGLDRLGKAKWRKEVRDVVTRLSEAMQADYVVIGGGNAKKLKKLPKRVERGDNANAFIGGFRMWEEAAAVGKRRKR